MSHIFHLTSRARSASTSRPKLRTPMPEELPPNPLKPPTRPASSKIEDKLMSYHIKAKKKLELLKQSIELEQMKELQTKPKILKKSKQLAEIHDQKLLKTYTEQVACKLQVNEVLKEVLEEEKEKINSITVESVPFANDLTRDCKKRTRSSSNFSFLPARPPAEVAEGGEGDECANGEKGLRGLGRGRDVDLDLPGKTATAKQEICIETVEFSGAGKLLKEKRDVRDFKDLETNQEYVEMKASRTYKAQGGLRNSGRVQGRAAGATGAAGAQDLGFGDDAGGLGGLGNKGRDLKKIDTGGKYVSEEVLTPQSVETYADSVDHQGKVQKKAGLGTRNLAPFQVKVSFECGLDLNKFLSRAK